jgi:aminoglycoside 6-adenylyltransferase
MMELEKIVDWADHKPSIRALILSGSLAGRGKKDDFSDYDIAVYTTDFDLIKNDDWLREIGDYLVCIHDEFEMKGHRIPTRLTIFNDTSKVDFSFHPMQELLQLANADQLPDDYNIGYRILVDKDDIAAKMKEPEYTGFQIVKPTAAEFTLNMHEFWFEIYHVIVSISRGDLWTAKWRASAANKWLLQMIEWHHGIKARWKFSPKREGKQMKDWVERKTWKELHECFGEFDKRDSKEAVRATMKLYRRIATKTAQHLKFEYDQKLDDGIAGLAAKWRFL